MAPTLKPNVRKLVATLAADPDVQSLARPLTPMEAAMTQHGYATWGSRIDGLARALSGSGEPTTNLRIVAAETLREAGGDGRGIDSAMHALFGVDAYDPMATLLPTTT